MAVGFSAPPTSATTAGAVPSLSRRSSASVRRSAPATPGTSRPRKRTPFTSSAFATMAAAEARSRSAFNAAICFSASLSWATSRSTRPTSWSGCTLNVSVSSETRARSAANLANASCATSASTRRTPEPIEASLSRLSMPIWAVVATWVPPHSSRDHGPESSTMRTIGGYFSPNMAMAPSALARSSGICCAVTSKLSAMAWLARASTSAFSCSDSPCGDAKSKRM